MGRQPRPRPRHAAAKPWACSSEGLGMQQPRPRHAAKAMACLRGQAARPLGRPSMHAAWGAVAARRGHAGMPRGWDAKAVACPWDPSKAMAALGGVLLPSPASLFGTLLLFPP
ncbi:hypothetical protein CMV_027500 [Castanea mollissima]|nr:hypothetical protein CMV_027500 [Castanea mollissima]